MTARKLSKIVAILLIIIIVGGLILGLIVGIQSYQRQKKIDDSLSSQGLSTEIQRNEG